MSKQSRARWPGKAVCAKGSTLREPVRRDLPGPAGDNWGDQPAPEEFTACHPLHRLTVRLARAADPLGHSDTAAARLTPCACPLTLPADFFGPPGPLARWVDLALPLRLTHVSTGQRRAPSGRAPTVPAWVAPQRIDASYQVHTVTAPALKQSVESGRRRADGWQKRRGQRITTGSPAISRLRQGRPTGTSPGTRTPGRHRVRAADSAGPRWRRLSSWSRA